MRRRLEALTALGVEFTEIHETLEFLGGDGDPTELLDGPFKAPLPYTPPPTRFSDGSWPVFYSAADWETAQAEVGYHVKRAAIGAPTTVFFQRLQCDVESIGYDLCASDSDWPFLIEPHERAYTSCQSLAREARANGAGALSTLSARRTNGINVPVFARPALSNPQIIGSAAVTADPGGLQVQLT